VTIGAGHVAHEVGPLPRLHDARPCRSDGPARRRHGVSLPRSTDAKWNHWTADGGRQVGLAVVEPEVELRVRDGDAGGFFLRHAVDDAGGPGGRQKGYASKGRGLAASRRPCRPTWTWRGPTSPGKRKPPPLTLQAALAFLARNARRHLAGVDLVGRRIATRLSAAAGPIGQSRYISSTAAQTTRVM
jgi:hypothetical protein